MLTGAFGPFKKVNRAQKREIVEFRVKQGDFLSKMVVSICWVFLGLSKVLDGLESSGWHLARLWTALDGALEAALERIWKALDSFDGFGRGLDSSGRLWTALNGLESFGWQPGACSQLAECRKSCSYHWWGAYFVKSMFYIAEACSLAKIIDFQ